MKSCVSVRKAYEAYEAYEVRFHAAVAESGTLRSLILALGRFALGENGVTGVTMGFHPMPRLGTSPQTPSPLRGGLKMPRKNPRRFKAATQRIPSPAIAQR